MKKEFETQVLDIDAEEIKEKLRELGAKEFPEVFQKRKVFNIFCNEEEGIGEWVRLRTNDKKTTITYKKRSTRKIDGTEEIETEVESFEKANAILSKLRWDEIYYQENKRTIFILNDIEFTLDKWPKIPIFLEIEGSSEEKIKEGLRLLNLEGKDAAHLGLVKIYRKYGEEIHNYKELKFEVD